MRGATINQSPPHFGNRHRNHYPMEYPTNFETHTPMRIINFFIMSFSMMLFPHITDPVNTRIVIVVMLLSTTYYILEVIRLTVKYYVESLHKALSKQND
jgi:hypothetical protein